MFIWLTILLTTQLRADCDVETICREEFERCYNFVLEETDFTDAEESCVTFGGHLTSIQNTTENEVIRTMASSLFISQSVDFWIGAQENVSWSWNDGSSWNYTHWFPFCEPTPEKYASMLLDNGYWRSSSPKNWKPYVCVVPYTPWTTIAPSPTCEVCTTVQPSIYTCENDWTYFTLTDSCYKIVSYCDQATCEQQCQEENAHLTSVHSAMENMFVTDLTSTDMIVTGSPDMTWIGLIKVNTSLLTFKWIDGSEVDFFHWADPEPSDIYGTSNCVEIYTDNMDKTKVLTQWNDELCDLVLRRGVCKKPANQL